MLKIIDFFALLLYCGVIFWLSNQPYLPVTEIFENQDKFHHLLAYSIMGLLAWRNFRHYVKTPIWLTIASIAFSSLYGISDEWHQSFVPGRMADALDWLADTIGSTITVIILTRFAPALNSSEQ
jgi:VanZ family protein